MPLGNAPNQTLFVYVVIDEPILIPMPKPSEGTFCNSLEYISPSIQSFFQWYFLRCQWKGCGIGWYE